MIKKEISAPVSYPTKPTKTRPQQSRLMVRISIGACARGFTPLPTNNPCIEEKAGGSMAYQNCANNAGTCSLRASLLPRWMMGT